jgi:hypothetical protein
MKKVILFLFLVISTCFFAQVPFDKNSVLNFQKEFGFLSTKKSINTEYIESTNPLIKTDLERIALKIPQILQDQKRIGNIPIKEEENLGEYINQQINKPLPLMIKNEPENP